MILSALKRVDNDLTKVSVLDHFTSNVGADDLPQIMLEQLGASTEWVALQSMGAMTYTVGIWGIVHHDDPRIAENLCAELGGAIVQSLVNRHEVTPVPGSDNQCHVYYEGKPPITDLQFGTLRFGQVMTRAFIATWSGKSLAYHRTPHTDAQHRAVVPIGSGDPVEI